MSGWILRWVVVAWLSVWGAGAAWGTRGEGPLASGLSIPASRFTIHDSAPSPGATDAPTGLLLEGYRYRDLETGQFLSRDPAGLVDGPNLYTYVLQNPWTAFDPLGLETANAAMMSTEEIRARKQGVDDEIARIERDQMAASYSTGTSSSNKPQGVSESAAELRNLSAHLAKVLAVRERIGEDGYGTKAYNVVKEVFGVAGTDADDLVTDWFAGASYDLAARRDGAATARTVSQAASIYLTVVMMPLEGAAIPMAWIGRGGGAANATPRLFHYTDSVGAAGIRAKGRTLIPGEAAAGKVWATTITPEQMFGPMGWLYRLGIGGGVNFERVGPMGIRYTGTHERPVISATATVDYGSLYRFCSS
jgi:RHS repeat-associated protein